MATLSKVEIESALKRVGELGAAEGLSIRLVLVGGGAMVLGFGHRASTKDLDVAILQPEEVSRVRKIAETIAVERGWDASWLNDAAKGYLVGLAEGPVIFSATGIEVIRPATEQLLAMKLCAWRDDVDVDDARRLLGELSGSREDVWSRIAPHL